jgi:hypothetical protein
MRTQTNNIIFFFFFFFPFFLFFFVNLSQGFINKSSYKSQDTFLNSNLIHHRNNASVFVIINSTSDVSQIQQMSQKIQISKDMQCSTC